MLRAVQNSTVRSPVVVLDILGGMGEGSSGILGLCSKAKNESPAGCVLCVFVVRIPASRTTTLSSLSFLSFCAGRPKKKRRKHKTRKTKCHKYARSILPPLLLCYLTRAEIDGNGRGHREPARVQSLPVLQVLAKLHRHRVHFWLRHELGKRLRKQGRGQEDASWSMSVRVHRGLEL